MGNLNSSKFRNWECENWKDYAGHYPKTPSIPDSVNSLIEPFSSIWNSGNSNNSLPAGWQKRSDNILVVLVRGLFGNLLPGNFTAVRERFSNLGARVIRPGIAAAGKVEENAEAISRQVGSQLGRGDEILFMCQSKGGLDALWAIMHDKAIRRCTRGVVLMQTPRGESPVMRSILTDDYKLQFSAWHQRVEQRVQKAIVSLPWFLDGCRQIMSPYIDEIAAEILAEQFSFPVVSVATWSLEPSSLLDSYHRKINLIRPGCAHDGQFFLEDQLWPNFNQLILGNIDHAESVMAGGGMDTARLWLALAHLLDLQDSHR